MSAVLTKDADLFTDLEIIALNEPGKGQALRRLMDRAGISSHDLASKVGYDAETDTGRVTVTHWIAERRWPSPSLLREVLSALNIDRKILIEKFGLALGTEITPVQESRQLLVSLRNDLMFEFDEFERKDIIFRNTSEKVLLFQAFKAFEDVRAAQLFFDRLDKHEDERRRRTTKQARNVSPDQQAWASGQVYDTPTSSASAVDAEHNSSQDSASTSSDEG